MTTYFLQTLILIFFACSSHIGVLHIYVEITEVKCS